MANVYKHNETSEIIVSIGDGMSIDLLGEGKSEPKFLKKKRNLENYSKFLGKLTLKYNSGGNIRVSNFKGGHLFMYNPISQNNVPYIAFFSQGSFDLSSIGYGACEKYLNDKINNITLEINNGKILLR
jgi:hypothetical protein